MTLLLSLALLLFGPCCLIDGGTCPVVLDCDEWDFGEVAWDGGTLFHTFKLTNTSDRDFRLGGLTTSCSCVSAYTGRIYIRAGKTVDLEVSVKAGAWGKTEYYVRVFDSNEKMIHRIKLKLNIK